MAIEQQDFLQEYLKDKPYFCYKSAYLFPYLCSCLEIKIYGINDNFYCKIETDEFNIPPLADFLIPQTYEKFKTIMDIFLGVENENANS